MDAVGHLLETWGYALLVLVGFVEFIGLPIASVPVLILGGAVAASGGLSLPLVALSAAAGGLVAASAGLARVAPRTFALADTAALLLWGSVYASLGFLFEAEVAGVVEWIAGFASIATGVAVLLVLSATGWRALRARMHAAGHAEAAQASSAGAERSDPLHDVTPSVHDPAIRPRTV